MTAIRPPIIVIYGDEPYQKQAALERALNDLLPPDVDRALALVIYAGDASEEYGGPTFAAVADDLATIPLLADRRVVAIRDADKFISAARERLERWVTHPPATGTLILECRSFPKTTRFAKAAVKAGGVLHECKQLRGRELNGFVGDVARGFGKRLDPAAAGRLLALIGQDQGLLAMEVEKLALYVGERDTITADDVAALVGLTREEKIFAVMDAAGLGQTGAALDLWRQVLATDRQAAFRAVGGLAFVLRKWLSAHQMAAQGLTAREIAPKVMMYGRQQELQTVLKRLSPARLARSLAALARLDTQAKRGQRSIETAIEGVLVDVAAPAA